MTGEMPLQQNQYDNSGNPPEPRWLDGIFQMFGMGRELWKDEDPDAYAKRLRDDWE
jgi:hypothetical protein